MRFIISSNCWKKGKRMKRNRAHFSRKIQGTALVLITLASLAHSQGLLKIPVYLKNREIWVEVPKTPQERAQGLMGRKHLGDNEGMLFIFEAEDYHSFWMKNTLLPLSIAFVDREGRIVGITDMEPLSLESHPPPKPILYALEMKKGWFSMNGIQVGDVLRFSK